MTSAPHTQIYYNRKNKNNKSIPSFFPYLLWCRATSLKKSLIHDNWSNHISPLRMAINIGYFGLSLNTSNLSGNPFMNCFLSAAAEVPAYIVSTFLLKKCPRKSLLSTFLIIGGGVILLIQFIPASK